MQTFKNPILAGFYPDPSVCRVGDDYYLVTSTFAYFPGVPIFHSRDLVNWQQVGNILDREEQLPLDGVEISRGIFAPTIRHHNGVFYMVTTNVSGGGNFIVTATEAAGPWSKPFWIKGAPGIDPSLFFDDDGKCYFHGVTERREGGAYYGDNEVYLQELDLNTMQLVGESHALWHGALKNAIWPEAPHIYKKDGYYYLLIAEGGTGHEHAVTIARSEHVTGPYEGAKINPILTHRHLGRGYPIVNVGHGDLVNTPNDDWYMVLLASRPYGGYYRNLGRESFLVPITWEGGWPLVNYGKGIVEDELPLPKLTPAPIQSIDTTPTKLDDFRWLYLRNSKEQGYATSDKAGRFGLRLAKADIGQLDNMSFIGLRQRHKSYTMAAKVALTSAAKGEAAGLVLFQNHKYNYQFLLSRDTLTVVKVENGEKQELASAAIQGDAVYLKVAAQEQDLTFSYSVDGKDFAALTQNADGRILSTDVAGGFVGTIIGLYATANGEESQNIAYFENICYDGIN